MTRARIASALLPLLITVPNAYGQILGWADVTEDVNGNLLAPDIVEYQVYVEFNGTDYEVGDQGPDTQFDLAFADPGCYVLHVKTVRIRGNESLASDPSNQVDVCIGEGAPPTQQFTKPLPPEAMIYE